MKLKGNQDMIRIVAIAAAFLVMFGIIGIALYSINNIDEINQRNRDREEGKNFAATVVQTTATTSVWEYLRASEAVAQTTIATEMIAEPVQTGESAAVPDDESINEVSAASEQTVTTTVTAEAQ